MGELHPVAPAGWSPVLYDVRAWLGVPAAPCLPVGSEVAEACGSRGGPERYVDIPSWWSSVLINPVGMLLDSVGRARRERCVLRPRVLSVGQRAVSFFPAHVIRMEASVALVRSPPSSLPDRERPFGAAL